MQKFEGYDLIKPYTDSDEDYLEFDSYIEDNHGRIMNLQEAIDAIKDSTAQIMDMITQRATDGKSWICPLCGHGRHSGSGIVINPNSTDRHGLKCFKAGCDFSGSILDLYARLYHYDLDDKKKFIRIIEDMAGLINFVLIYEDGTHRTVSQKPAASAQTQAVTAAAAAGTETTEEIPNTEGKYRDYIDRLKSAADVPEVYEYLKGRGFKESLIRTLKIKYDPAVYFNRAGRELPAIVMPYNKECDYYAARNLAAEHSEHYFTKPNTKDAGNEPLYNAKGLKSGKPCFITEGQLDAASILQAGGIAAAVCGSAKRKLIDTVQKYQEDSTITVSPIVLCYDIDRRKPGESEGAGQKAEREMAALLDGEGIFHYEAKFDLREYGISVNENGEPTEVESVDPNDLLVLNPAQFEHDVQKISADCLKEWNDWKEAQKPKSDIEIFLEEIYTEKYKPIRTNITNLDRLMGGGFLPQTLILLGADAGIGKTTLVTDIFENLAKNGQYSLYFNLEMSKSQLLAKSIARMVYKDSGYKTKLSARKILQGYQQDDLEKALVHDAAQKYDLLIGDRLKYNPGDTGSELDEIYAVMKNEADKAVKAGRSAPNVCIDYLQIITDSTTKDQVEMIKRAVMLFKEYAEKYNVIVFLIMAQNRESNKSKTPSLRAGRDTSNLEYSADVQIELIRTKDVVKLYVVKNRFGESSNRHYAKYIMHGDQSYLEDNGNGWDPDQENQYDQDGSQEESQTEYQYDQDGSQEESQTEYAQNHANVQKKSRKEQRKDYASAKVKAKQQPADKGDLPKNLEDLPEEIDFTWND